MLGGYIRLIQTLSGIRDHLQISSGCSEMQTQCIISSRMSLCVGLRQINFSVVSGFTIRKLIYKFKRPVECSLPHEIQICWLTWERVEKCKSQRWKAVWDIKKFEEGILQTLCHIVTFVNFPMPPPWVSEKNLTIRISMY